jgi:serine/threonine protein kinase
VTFKIGAADDLWLHARGIPGAHVLIKSGGREVPVRFDAKGRLVLMLEEPGLAVLTMVDPATGRRAAAGKVPFPGGSTRDKARRHLEDIPWHPKRLNNALDDEFVDLIADLMEKDPRRRIQTAADAAQRLELWAGDQVAVISQQAAPSRWMAAPLPSVDEVIELPQDTEGEPSVSNPDQAQGTYPVNIGSQETNLSSSRSRSIPGLPMSIVPEDLSPANVIALTLAISVPVSMFIGALLAAVLMYLLR